MAESSYDIFNMETAVTEIKDRGYTMIRDFTPGSKLSEVGANLDSYLGSYKGRNNFEGALTERIYTLVARDRLFQDIVEDERIMRLCAAFLEPNFLLTASQAICIYPGETPQPFHADDAFYSIPRPRPMVSLSTIVAVDSFTVENGATELIPGSHLWGDDEVVGQYRGGNGDLDLILERGSAANRIVVEMPAGSCIVFSGTLLHRGGANRSDSRRRAFSNQYCQPWARTQEIFFLAIPSRLVSGMSSRLQSLLGYSIHPPFMGQLIASHPLKGLQPGYVPPVMRDK